MAGPLSQLLLERLPGRTGDAALEGELRRLLDEAARAWPALHVEHERFLSHIAARLPRDKPLLEALQALSIGDLFLACACAAGDTRALRAFEERYLVEVPEYLRRQRPTPTFVDEVKQALRERLFLAPSGSQPKIASYRGTGALRSWLRVATVRAALNLRRGRKPEVALREDEPKEDRAFSDPELDYIRRTYRDDFRASFQSILSELPAKERHILRLHFVEGTVPEAIAELYGVHRTTVVRWLERIRRDLLEQTRRALSARLGLETARVDSIMRLFQTSFELTVSGALGAPPAGKSR